MRDARKWGAALGRGSRSGLRWGVAASALLGASALGSPAAAAPSARLVYVREPEAASCPDEAAVRAAVAARLGYDPFFASARATLVAEVRRDGRTYKVSIKLIDEASVLRGARDLTHEGEPCSEVIDLMALTMSIAIDPLSMTGPRKAEPDPDPPPTTAPPAPAEPPAPPAPRRGEPPPTAIRPAVPPAPSQVHLDVLMGPSLSVGVAPSPSFGARLGLLLHLGALAPFVEVRADLPASRSAGRGSVGTSLVAGAVGACLAWRWLFGCGLGALGALSATSEGIASPRSVSAPHGALGGRLGAELGLAPQLALRGYVEGLAVLTPHTLTLDGAEVTALPGGAFSAGISLAVRFF